MPATPTEFPTPDPAASLKGATWLTDTHLQRLMQAIAGSDEEIRVVGGAVRNALMGREVADVDLATTATPTIVMSRARRHGMKPVPTGLEHGTVTVVVEGKPFEVTTLREDIATDGRHATVKFGRDWIADAMRRDFTVNALYATRDGDIIDLVGGVADCNARRICFIGDPEARIREDYLRILRLFRFHATFSDGPVNPEGLAAATGLREGLLTLSAERIGQEILKLIVADHAPDVLRIMRDTGILRLALGTEEIDLARFNRMHENIAALCALDGVDFAELKSGAAALLLASLATRAWNCKQYASRLRLSNAMRDRMTAAWGWAWTVQPSTGDTAARRLIYQMGKEVFRDAVLTSAASPEQTINDQWPIPKIIHLLDLAKAYTAPKFPVSGRDLLDLGVPEGKLLGNALEHIKDHWIASDFTLTKQQLIAILRETPGFFSG